MSNDSTEDCPGTPGQAMSQPSSRSESLIREFVAHWGLMARTWGINSSMGELFALLYITGTDWTAEDLRNWLAVSRGNVSMNLRELLAWGVVHKVHRPGERRELFRAETDVWVLFRRILSERKRRELDPSLRVLDRTVRLADENPDLADLKATGRVVATVLPADRFAGRPAALDAIRRARARRSPGLRRSTRSLSRRVMEHARHFV